MSSSILSSQGIAMALATAIAALSGTLIVISFISSEGKKKEMEKKKKKKRRVHFSEDVLTNNSIGKKREKSLQRKKGLALCSPLKMKKIEDGEKSRGLQPNRVALYNGILRDRLVHRMAYSL